MKKQPNRRGESSPKSPRPARSPASNLFAHGSGNEFERVAEQLQDDLCEFLPTRGRGVLVSSVGGCGRQMLKLSPLRERLGAALPYKPVPPPKAAPLPAVDLIFDMIFRESHKLPSQAAWVEIAYHTLHEGLMQQMLDAASLGAALRVLRPYVTPTKFQPVFARLRSNVPVQKWLNSNFFQLRYLFAKAFAQV